MTFRRIVLIGIVLLAGTYFAQGASRGATTAAPAGLPLYQFAETGAGPLPWNAVSLQSQLNATTMLGGPHGVTNAAQGVLAYRTNHSDLALFTQSSTGLTQWIDLTRHNDVPEPAADPIPFFDPSGNAELLYVDVSGHVILLSPNVPDTKLWSRLHYDTPWRPYVTTDLTDLTGVVAANGLPSIQVSGANATVAFRTAVNTIEVLELSWSLDQPVPVYSQNSFNEKSASGVTTAPTSTTTTSTTAPKSTTTTTTPKSTTTTTAPKSTTTTTTPKSTTTTTTTTPFSGASAFASDPVVLPGVTPTFATTLNNGDLVLYTNTGASIRSWTTENLTQVTGAPSVSGALALGTSTSNIDLAALTSNGSVELFTTQYAAVLSNLASRTTIVSTEVWNTQNLTALATGAPPLSGALSVQVTLSQVAVAGQAANWGDLFVLTNPAGSATWSATDVSVTAGTSARTVGDVVTGLAINGQLTLYAAGVNSPPPQGVGVYAIPTARWSRAISDGWPIISETGGLGTQAAPWVGFTGAPSVATSPDYLLGQAIYNSHKRVTWLSFWTVSGPLANQKQTASDYYEHGFAAGVWVATQIDSYRNLGVGLKPDWVILDPEGYPDNHSNLDALAGSSKATLAKYATYWSSTLKGWQSGINSVDPKLNAAVYASQSEYRNYQLSTLSLPVFVAVAFTNNGPTPVTGASGSNIRGFISFGAACTPARALASETTTLLNPPWAGQFNTLQFNAGVYCAPPAT
ncbi:MAG TPA: hypothetical protein VNF08_00935 [Acidimicrobiales bacterium]|nr:hypothetical protein [Acidimicrobiales bacterium]